MSQNRYDALRNRIATEFSRTTTLTPTFGTGGGEKTLINLDDHTDTYALSARFEKFGPFNAVVVRNFGDADLTVYTNQERTASVTIPSGGNKAIRVLNRIPTRYVRYLRLEADGEVEDGDVEIYVGNEVDSVELSLLKMAGQLDVNA